MKKEEIRVKSSIQGCLRKNLLRVCTTDISLHTANTCQVGPTYVTICPVLHLLSGLVLRRKRACDKLGSHPNCPPAYPYDSSAKDFLGGKVKIFYNT